VRRALLLRIGATVVAALVVGLLTTGAGVELLLRFVLRDELVAPWEQRLERLADDLRARPPEDRAARVAELSPWFPGEVTLGPAHTPAAPGELPIDADTSLRMQPPPMPEPPAVLRVVIPLALGLVALLTAAVVALPLARRLERLERGIRALSRGDFAVRLSDGADGGIGGLEAVLDDAATRLDALFSEREEMMQAVAHELATPLARLRFLLARLEGDATVTAIEGEVQEIAALADELADWVTADSAPLVPQLMAVDEAAQELAELADRPVQVVIAPDARGARAAVSPRLLDRAVGNLLRNACQHAATEVQLRVERAGGQVRVTVTDDGPGIPLADRARVLLPFQRVGDGPGLGLGLAIARRIAERHGGGIEVGGERGAEVSLWLPIRRDPPPAPR
jgi:signal transduction histidine kinase